MYKRLLKDTSLYSVGPFLARGFSLITLPIYTRILSPSDYGALDILSYTAVLIGLVVGAALDQAVARFYLDAADDAERTRIASTVLIYYVLAFALLVLLARPFAYQLAHGAWLHGLVDQKTVVLVLIFIFANAIFYIASNQLKYLFYSKQYAICSIGNTVLSMILSLVFVGYLRWGVFGMFLGQTFGAGVFASLALYYARARYAWVFHWKLFQRLLAYSLPLVPGTLSFYLMQYIDRFAINDLINLREVGIYGIGARLASLVNLFLAGFHGAWNPTVFKSFRDAAAPERFRVVFNHYLFAVLAMMVGLSLFSREALLLLTTRTFSQGFVVVPLLVFSAILASIGQYFTYGIQIAQKSHYRLFINVAAVAINVALNYVLIPRVGMVGAALATMLAFVFLATAGMRMSQKLYYVPYQWRNIVISCALAAAISSSVTLIHFDITWQVEITKIVVALSTMLGLIYLLDIQWNRVLHSWITDRGNRKAGS